MIKKADLRLRVFIILGLIVVSFFYVFPLEDKINLGLDLKGGMYLLLRADTSRVSASKISDALGGAIERIRNRIDSFGIKETPIQRQGEEYILVQIPGKVDRNIINKLKEVGKLEFKLVEEDEDKLNRILKGETIQGYEVKSYEEANLLLHSQASLTGSDLKESFVGFDNYATPTVNLKLNSEGAKKFAEITEKNVGRRLAILLDDKVISAPRIREAILSGEAQITGNFSLDEAKALSSVLNSGALPVPLIVEEERTVGPLLGSDSVQRGIKSIILGAGLVVIFMVFYYLRGGIIAISCLVMDLLFILAALNLFGGTLTLPGIAGIILTLGMAVDANVLIFERIREELLLKKPLSLAIKNGFERARRTIFDANLTTLIAALFLFIYGSGPIRGFATTLSLGIVASIFTAIFVSKTIFALLLKEGMSHFPMLKLFPSSHINFVRYRNMSLLFSFILIAAGMYSFVSRGEKIYGIDFKGGQVLEYKLIPPQPIETIREIFKKNGLEEVIIQDFKDMEGGIIVKSREDIGEKVEKILKGKFKNVERLKVTTIGPAVGYILKKKAFFSVSLSLLGILIYIVCRFKHFDFALAAVIALFHDCLVSLGFLSFMGLEINLLTITAILTIAGYSINDTIVIYDRIREIASREHKLPLKEVINKAINNVLSRTIITSLTTLMVVLSIYLVGGEALHAFSFTLLVGFIAGTYSSIYIASPLVLSFQHYFTKKLR